MGNLLQTTIVFVLVLGGMIVIHEFGHFIVAKLFGIRVDVFSVGFGKRLFGIKKGDTDYRLSLIPLGGYVKMAGENLDEQVTGAPYEFQSKPKWQRFGKKNRKWKTMGSSLAAKTPTSLPRPTSISAKMLPRSPGPAHARRQVASHPVSALICAHEPLRSPPCPP